MGVVAAVGRPTIPLVLGPAELVGILIFLLLAGVAFAAGSPIGALAAVVVGLLLSAVGTDIETGAPRFTLGISALEDGVPGVALGFFVIAGAIHDWRHARVDIPRNVGERSSRGALRRTILALVAGFLPTNGGLVGTTTSERQSRPSRDILDPASQSDLYGAFGAALAADIRFSVSLMIPLMVWFAPSDVVTALLRKIISTQEVLTQQPWPRTDIVWLVCATLILVHVVPLIMWVTTGLRWQPIRLDARIIAPLMIAACCGLVFAITRSVFDYSLARSLFNIAFMLGFGVIGYGMFRLNVDRTLLLFAFLLEPTLEENFRRSLLIARGDVAIFFQRPISFGFLAAGMLLLIAVRLWRSNADKRQLA
jgi:TctA family transporter